MVNQAGQQCIISFFKDFIVRATDQTGSPRQATHSEQCGCGTISMSDLSIASNLLTLEAIWKQLNAFYVARCNYKSLHVRECDLIIGDQVSFSAFPVHPVKNGAFTSSVVYSFIYINAGGI
ncbi:hypothetical protein CDAR_219261 [Caerostris darwini]|uniref:Uncharacterized protein n=1 Tax=Caerostris darwini TaxID=1538125 RepID=A0AAV4PJA5_9ARAC|nr:hypothetical protein CDAR_219261 [Caerostris darwini]